MKSAILVGFDVPSSLWMCKTLSKRVLSITSLGTNNSPNLDRLTKFSPNNFTQFYVPGGGGEAVAISAETMVNKVIVIPINAPIKVWIDWMIPSIL